MNGDDNNDGRHDANIVDIDMGVEEVQVSKISQI